MTPVRSPASLGLISEQHKSDGEGGRGGERVCGRERREGGRGGDGVARIKKRGCDVRMGKKEWDVELVVVTKKT